MDLRRPRAASIISCLSLTDPGERGGEAVSDSSPFERSFSRSTIFEDPRVESCAGEADVSELQTFLWGCFGSCAVETLLAYRLVISGPWPPRYRRLRFWVVRVLAAVVAGLLAVAMGSHTPIGALYVGAAAPLILEKLLRGGRFRDSEACDQ
jgi:hypothetical protein